MAIDNTAGGLKQQIEQEIKEFTTGVVPVGEGYDYSQHKLVRRIAMFESKVYPGGKFDKQGNYKYWYDITTPLIENEIKNIDFDTKDIRVTSERKKDALAVIITNLKLKDYLKENGEAEEINAAVEEGSGWGNIVWKKVKKRYERVDLRNFYVINQTARTLADTPVIERHQFSASDLRAKMQAWDNVKEVLDQLESNTYKSEIQIIGTQTTTPYYEIYERNGEVCLKDLKLTNGEDAEDGDEDKYVFAKVIVAGSRGDTTGVTIQYVLFAQELKGKDNSKLYKEFHRGRYKGRWFREGLYEIEFDCQVRANEVGNQIARGLEYASKVVLQSADKLIIQNVGSDLKNGDVIRTANLTQVPLELRGMAQLLEEWNRNIEHARLLANAHEVSTGETMPSQTPFQLGALLNQNVNKLFDYIRQKLAIPYSEMYEEYVIPEMVKDLSAQDILKLTGDPSMMDRLYELVVDCWYINNLLAFPPHLQQDATAIKQTQLDALRQRPELLMEGISYAFKDFTPSVVVDITGENSTLPQDLQTLGSFIQLEQDPVRRQAMIEIAMAKKGIDVGGLPKSDPAALSGAPAGPVPSPMQPQKPQKANV